MKFSKDYETKQTDVLIIGAGGAGLRAAIEVAKSNVAAMVISKDPFGRAHTEKAMGGVNVAIKDPATPEQHYQDTVKGGWYIGNQIMVDVFTREMPDRIHDLVSYGVNFDRLPDGSFYTWAGGKQTVPLNLCAGDYTGREMMNGLVHEAQKVGVTYLADHLVTKLFTVSGKIAGVLCLNLDNGTLLLIEAKAVLLAAGGAGQLYKITSNEPSNTGEGYSLAFDIGADLVDMEMVQFHPTGMAFPESVRGSLITEKVRGHKGILLNSKGERFMLKYQPERKELAGRDEVARAIYTEVKEGRGTQHGGVFLDVRELGKEEILKHIPEVYEKFKNVGVDISQEMMEITPTMHHMMGGVKINEWGESSVSGFFAAGEVTGGIHGANRLGGNSLAEGQVFGRRAGISAVKFVTDNPQQIIPQEDIQQEISRLEHFTQNKKFSVDAVVTELKNVMWDDVGIVRNQKSLTQAQKSLQELTQKVGQISADSVEELQKCIETTEMVKVATLVVAAAKERKESRGAHFRDDYPKMDEAWEKNILLKKKGNEIAVEIVPTVKRDK